MRSLDTNILVRLLTRDDEQQFRRAKNIFAGGEIWIGKTVLLETEWVLRSKYLYDSNAVLTALRGLLALDEVTIEDEGAIELALELFEQGLDFADALHLSSRPEGASFLTFDERLAQHAKRFGVPRVSKA
jgi:predicted nucleic-acid-binding protein